VAPVVAPATGGVTGRIELDDRQRLHVAICVDGKRYETSMDLAPAIAALMARFAQYHTDLHKHDRGLGGAMPVQSVIAGDVVGSIDRAVEAAGDAMVGELLQRHAEVICGSWLSDIGNAVSSVASGIAGGVSSTLSALKGPIGAAAGIAAASGAALIPGVGPLAAPLAAKLANDIVQGAAGDDTSKKRVMQASQQAATDPTVAAALAAAKKAAAQSTVAHHVRHTARRAAAGDHRAQAQIADVVQDAEKGDPAAHAVTPLVSDAFVKELADRVQHSDWGAKLWEQITGRGPSVVSPTATSGWVDVVGAVPWYSVIGAVPWHSVVGGLPWYTVIGAAVDEHRTHAASLANAKRGNVVGVVRTANGTWFTLAFGSSDDADDWLGMATRDPSGYVYAAYFDKKSPLFPRPENEKLGGTRAPSAPGLPIPRGAAEAA
jgi:hypothetical protein